MVADGEFGKMVALQQNRLVSVPFEEVANKTRTVPPDNPMIAAALAVGTSFGVRDFEYRMKGTQKSKAVT
jgi:6-phosphofructokinase 1